MKYLRYQCVGCKEIGEATEEPIIKSLLQYVINAKDPIPCPMCGGTKYVVLEKS